jgi:23S rRNA (cytidine1920-2'-O)/16S rRNA (cytidine1409-2'-O)-methyltransferase
VSFISLKLIIPPLLKCLSKKTDIILLVKPQFELEPKDLKKGIVKNEELRKKALNDIIDFVNKFKNLKIIGFIDSPIKGEKGNLEFLLYLIYE